MNHNLYLLDYEEKIDTIQAGKPVIKTSDMIYTQHAMLEKKEEIIKNLNEIRQLKIIGLKQILEQIDLIYEKCEIDYAGFGAIYRIYKDEEPELFKLIEYNGAYTSIINKIIIIMPPKKLLKERLEKQINNMSNTEIKWDSYENNYSFRKVSDIM